MRNFDKLYMNIAFQFAEQSYASRKKVGAILVKDNSIISDGYNGTPSGFSNKCEDENGNTHWYVLHAEANAILKVAKNSSNCKDAVLYITMSPCKDCCKLIIQSGIKKVIYSERYRDESSIIFLNNYGIECQQIKD